MINKYKLHIMLSMLYIWHDVASYNNFSLIVRKKIVRQEVKEMQKDSYAKIGNTFLPKCKSNFDKNFCLLYYCWVNTYISFCKYFEKNINVCFIFSFLFVIFIILKELFKYSKILFNIKVYTVFKFLRWICLENL